MKTIAFLTTLLMLTVGSLAQSAMDKVFDKYSEQDGFTTVYISKYMFDMFRNKEADPKTQDDFAQVMNKLTSIRILTTDDDRVTPVTVDLYKEIMKILPSNVYKEIMVVKDKDSNVRFYAREVNNKVAELLLVVGGKEGKGSALISIQGEIDMKNISKLGSAMNVEGMENLEKMKERDEGRGTGDKEEAIRLVRHYCMFCVANPGTISCSLASQDVHNQN